MNKLLGEVSLTIFVKIHNRVSSWGRSGGAMVLGKLPVPGRPKIWMIVGQGPIALALGADGGCLDILPSSILSLLFPLSLGDGPI